MTTDNEWRLAPGPREDRVAIIAGVGDHLEEIIHSIEPGKASLICNAVNEYRRREDLKDTITGMRILYVCTECWSGDVENCAYQDRHELRVMPDGDWLCYNCFHELRWELLPTDTEGEPIGEPPHWRDFSPPPNYVPEPSHDQAALGDGDR